MPNLPPPRKLLGKRASGNLETMSVVPKQPLSPGVTTQQFTSSNTAQLGAHHLSKEATNKRAGLRRSQWKEWLQELPHLSPSSHLSLMVGDSSPLDLVVSISSEHFILS